MVIIDYEYMTSTLQGKAPSSTTMPQSFQACTRIGTLHEHFTAMAPSAESGSGSASVDRSA